MTHAGGADPALAARNPLRYRAYYHDAATGLYYLPTRYYDPGSARFLSADPAPPKAWNPSSLNRYSYCFGDPVGRIDPDGRDIMQGAYYSAEQRLAGAREVPYPHDWDSAAGGYTHAAWRSHPGNYRGRGTGGQEHMFAEARARAAIAAIAARASALAQRTTRGDGTPYGRNNTTLWPSAPGSMEYALAIGGTGLDLVGGILTAALPPLGVVTLIVGFVVDGSMAAFYYQPRRERGYGTRGDFWFCVAGALPFGSPAQGLVYIVDASNPNAIPWAEPQR